MIVTCEHCQGKLDVDHLAEHPDMISLVMKTLGSRKRKQYNISEEQRLERSERMIEFNLNRAAARRMQSLPRPKNKLSLR
jgi:hypothetical protein